MSKINALSLLHMTAFSILGFQFYVSVFLLVPECDALCFFYFVTASLLCVFLCRAVMGLQHQQIFCNDLRPNVDGFLIALKPMHCFIVE